MTLYDAAASLVETCNRCRDLCIEAADGRVSRSSNPNLLEMPDTCLRSLLQCARICGATARAFVSPQELDPLLRCSLLQKCARLCADGAAFCADGLEPVELECAALCHTCIARCERLLALLRGHDHAVLE
jgi:hypothetical protein